MGSGKWVVAYGEHWIDAERIVMAYIEGRTEDEEGEKFRVLCTLAHVDGASEPVELRGELYSSERMVHMNKELAELNTFRTGFDAKGEPVDDDGERVFWMWQ